MSCPDCFRGAIHTHATPQGKMDTVHGIRSYVAGGSDPTRSKSTILYLPDVFSLKLQNNLILADTYASETGCRVILPDVVYNGGMDPSMLAKMETLLGTNESWSFGGVWAKFSAVVTLLPHILPFALFGRPPQAYPTVLKLARDLKAELPEGGKLGVSGFCWGGWGSTKLCAETARPDDESSGRLIDAHFNGHPSFIKGKHDLVIDAITKYKVPYAMAVAELDWEFNEAVAQESEAVIREKTKGKEDEYTFDFQIYKGCRHGFCVRAQESTVGFEGYERAVKQATTWYNKYLN